jgi:hypothetical protein
MTFRLPQLPDLPLPKVPMAAPCEAGASLRLCSCSDIGAYRRQRRANTTCVTRQEMRMMPPLDCITDCILLDRFKACRSDRAIALSQRWGIESDVTRIGASRRGGSSVWERCGVYSEKRVGRNVLCRCALRRPLRDMGRRFEGGTLL